MEKSGQIAWKIVPLRHYFPPKVVPLIEITIITKHNFFTAQYWPGTAARMLADRSVIDHHLITSWRWLS
jgi:hypothetical protein